jgi:hypothetical protein
MRAILRQMALWKSAQNAAIYRPPVFIYRQAITGDLVCSLTSGFKEDAAVSTNLPLAYFSSTRPLDCGWVFGSAGSKACHSLIWLMPQCTPRATWRLRL